MMALGVMTALCITLVFAWRWVLGLAVLAAVIAGAVAIGPGWCLVLIALFWAMTK